MSSFIPRLITGLIFGAIFLTTLLFLPPIYFTLVLSAILVEILVLEWPALFAPTSTTFWLLMPCYILLPFALLMLLNHSPLYHPLLVCLFVMVFSFDVGSYLAGKLCGKHKLAPAISPGKTWEGALGGYAITLGVISIILATQKINVPFAWLAAGTLFICILALLGDLFESWLKRRVNLKDSGTLLPGHGGFLDRFDSVLFVVFFFYFLRNYLVQFLMIG